MTQHLDAEQLAELRAWAGGLLADERADMRAAAKALLLMADEIERLRQASRSAFADDVRDALARRLGTSAPDAESSRE
jgi:protein-disulfide isomerase-like protein with CxxC motif